MKYASHLLCAAALLFSLTVAGGAEDKPPPLKVCATVPDLKSLAEEIGGDEVKAQAFAKGAEDPHHVEARPGFIRELADADLFILSGLELEIGWAPLLLRQCRNARVQPGAAGYLDVSTAVTPLEVPSGAVDRSRGDLHPGGNPHYLVDPLGGLKAARLIADKLAVLRPARKPYFEERYKDFRRRLGVKMVGEKLFEKYEFEKLCLLFEHNRLSAFLDKQGESDKLGGWLKDLTPHWGAKAVSDHSIYPYFARRFGLELAGSLEPLPGIAPTTRHLQGIIEKMDKDRIRLILTAPYFNKKHAEFVARKTGAKIVSLAHQVGATDVKDDDYLAMCGRNVAALLEALKSVQDGK